MVCDWESGNDFQLSKSVTDQKFLMSKKCASRDNKESEPDKESKIKRFSKC